MSNVNDFHMTDDIDADWSQVNSQQQALLEALYRRLLERPRGLFYEAVYGLGVQDFLSAAVTEARVIALITIECRKEDAVKDVTVEITPTGDYEIQVDSDFGEFSLTLQQESNGT